MDAITIIQEYEELIDRVGVSPHDISHLVGLHPSTLYRLVKGKERTSQSTLCSLALLNKWMRWTLPRIERDPKVTRSKHAQLVVSTFSEWINE